MTSVEVPAVARGPRTHIKASRGWSSINLRELWSYRELFFFLVWRDFKVRYKQTSVGVAWALVQPLLTLGIFSLIFGRVAKLSSEGIPYPVFFFVALFPWQFFATALSHSGTSLVSNQQLVTKVYFPRLVIPAAAALAGLVDLAIASVVLLGLMLYYGIVPSLTIVALPLFIALLVATTVAFGLWLSALNVRYRDVQYTIPFLTQFLFFATPIAYSSALLPDTWRVFFGLNPMLGVVEGFRWSLLGTSLDPAVGVSIGTAIALLVGGVFYFRRVERHFADIV
jgi:lipopolysaccharide transport system permease protein